MRARAGELARPSPVGWRRQGIRRCASAVVEAGGAQLLHGRGVLSRGQSQQVADGRDERVVEMIGLGEASMWSAARRAKAASIGAAALDRSMTKRACVRGPRRRVARLIARRIDQERRHESGKPAGKSRPAVLRRRSDRARQ